MICHATPGTNGRLSFRSVGWLATEPGPGPAWRTEPATSCANAGAPGRLPNRMMPRSRTTRAEADRSGRHMPVEDERCPRRRRGIMDDVPSRSPQADLEILELCLGRADAAFADPDAEPGGTARKTVVAHIDDR